MKQRRIVIALAIIFFGILCFGVWFWYVQKSLEITDTYGGFTPEETMEKYVKALQNEDFRLASRYFVKDKQEEEFILSLSASRYALEEYVRRLSAPSETECLFDALLCTIRIPFDGPDIFIRLQKNEVNRWKILSL